MRWSRLFIPTLRENPAGSESASQKLLQRAGYLRPPVWLPLAIRSLEKIERMVRAGMEEMGAQEIGLPDSQSDAIIYEIARGELRSPKQLPQIWFARRAGRIESFPFGAGNSDRTFHELFGGVLAQSGVRSSAFMAPTEAGGETLVECAGCGYAECLDYAVSNATVPVEPDPEGDAAPEAFYTPGRKTIAEVSEFANLPATSQMKSLVMATGGEPVLALVRGDHQLSRPKLAALLGVPEVVPAQPADIVRWFGAEPGSLGPVGAGNIRVVADTSLAARRNMVAGANRTDYHLRNVTPGRDFKAEFADIRRVAEGDACVTCGSPLALRKAVQLAGLRKGFYWIDLVRILHALVEQNNDEAGMMLPAAVAPFTVIITPVNNNDTAMREAAESIYRDCLASRIDALYDDRDERPGAKFKDADLIGVPFRITLGKKLGQGLVEFNDRKARTSRDLTADEALNVLRQQP